MQERSGTEVVIVGGGFAGVGCGKGLADDDRVRVTLVDQNGYHQFQPAWCWPSSAISTRTSWCRASTRPTT
jgi:NADH dehydrogenase FAD-containing subunit